MHCAIVFFDGCGRLSRCHQKRIRWSRMLISVESRPSSSCFIPHGIWYRKPARFHQLGCRFLSFDGYRVVFAAWQPKISLCPTPERPCYRSKTDLTLEIKPCWREMNGLWGGTNARRRRHSCRPARGKPVIGLAVRVPCEVEPLGASIRR